MQKIEFKNIVWKEGKYFVAQCLNIDISSFGKTKKEALDNLKEALELYLEDIKSPKIVRVERSESGYGGTADALGLEPSGSNPVGVQIHLPALAKNAVILLLFYFIL